jgi:hypothetical protein
LYKQDDEGTITESDLEKLPNLEARFGEIEDAYMTVKAALDATQNEANAKTYARTQAETAKAAAALTEVSARAAVAKAIYDTVVKAVTDQTAAYDDYKTKLNALNDKTSA